MKPLTLLLALVLGALIYHPADAQDCQRYKDRADHFAKLRRAGGTSARMARWQSERNRYHTLYQDCQNNPSSTSIKTTGGPGANTNYADRRKLRPINTDDQVIRTVIETCNYWIQEHNTRPTRSSLSQRDYACRAADRSQNASRAPQTINAEHTRSLNECIKPGNVVDDDVAACLRGQLEPDWLGTKDTKRN